MDALRTGIPGRGGGPELPVLRSAARLAGDPGAVPHRPGTDSRQYAGGQTAAGHELESGLPGRILPDLRGSRIAIALPRRFGRELPGVVPLAPGGTFATPAPLSS